MVDWFLRRAFTRGLRDGLAGGSGAWLVIAAVAGLWQLARREPKSKVIRMKLEPGTRYSIVCSDEPSRR
jgi:hypothetical protein